jgi:hypothetical protein
MPKFAVYYIPEVEEVNSKYFKFYQLGSSILGYDVRAGDRVPMAPALRAKLGEFDPAWQANAQPYGFHLTIGDAIDFNTGDLQQIEAELVAILNCFAASDKFELEQSSDFIPDWGAPIVLRYDPNEHLRALHLLVISCINTIGTGSSLLRRYLEDPNQYANEPHQAARTLKFYSPRILGDYHPHFTLLNPYSGSDRTALVRALKQVFEAFTKFTVNSICLSVQDSAEKNWTIYKEFKRDAIGRWSAICKGA